MKPKPLILALLLLLIPCALFYAQGPGWPPPPWGDGPPPPGGRPGFGGPPPGGGAMPESKPAAQQPDAKVLNTMTPQQKAATFSSNVKVTVTDKYMTVESDGIPNHPHANFPTSYNPNRILKQDYHFKIPLYPQFAEKTTKLPFGPVGVAINGIPFYNPYNAQGRDAVMGPNAEIFDSCCGHPDQMGRYHYHKYPVCINNPFMENPGKHSPIIGWAFDGFPICGPNGDGGKPPADLDSSNGHIDAGRGYHYHVTAKFPYILGSYKGVVEMSNFPGPQVWGAGRPPGPGR
jgi:YHYH protein